MSKLHKTVHWRSVKRIIRLIAKAENISLENYNLNNIRCYQTYGAYLNGKNTKFSPLGSPFSNSNVYDIFEVPTNETKLFKICRELFNTCS